MKPKDKGDQYTNMLLVLGKTLCAIHVKAKILTDAYSVVSPSKRIIGQHSISPIRLNGVVLC